VGIKRIVVEKFVLRVPANWPGRRGAALCAGISYSLRHWGWARQKVGIAGLGGRSLVLVRPPGRPPSVHASPARPPTRAGWAPAVVVSANRRDEAPCASVDFILTRFHPARPGHADALLKRDATLCLVGAPAQPHPSPAVFNLVFRRRQIAGSLIGGIRETQEMLDFCGQHGITSDIELIRMQDINVAYERMLKSDVKYRFVIDMSSL
jgi:uncharacterized zinc-type alcohol dehydrogenase-like protein